MTEDHDYEAIYRELLVAINRHDADAVAASFAEDGVVIDFSDPSVVHRGRAAVAAVARSVYEAFPDVTYELVSLVVGRDRLSAELLMQATPAGRTKPVEVNLCGCYVFDGDKVASEHIYIDSAQLAA